MCDIGDFGSFCAINFEKIERRNMPFSLPGICLFVCLSVAKVRITKRNFLKNEAI